VVAIGNLDSSLVRITGAGSNVFARRALSVDPGIGLVRRTKGSADGNLPVPQSAERLEQVG
jgi:hypothetical protein